MTRPRVLVTGASGLFGANFLLQQAEQCDLIAAFHQHPIADGPYETLCIDISGVQHRDDALEAFHAARPTVIVHAAAMANVDACEEQPALAQQLNHEGTANVARAAQQVGADLIVLSTDYVFDGARGGYTEEDDPHPLGVYAKTKWAGEQAALRECPTATVIRTTLYGWNAQEKQSFAERVLDAGRGGAPVTAFTDMYWSPILVNDLADAVATLIARPMPGLFHVAGRERCSRYDFARAVVEAFGLDPAVVRPGRLAQATLRAPRPPDASLDVSKFERTFGRLPTIAEGLARMRTLEQAGWPGRLQRLIQT